MRKLTVLVLLAGLAAFPAGADAAPTSRGVDLGGVNLNAYCGYTFGRGYQAKLVGHSAGDWRCVPRYGDYGQRQISVQRACELQYRRYGVQARATNWGNPYSWRCFAPSRGDWRGRDHRGGPGGWRGGDSWDGGPRWGY